MKFSTSLSLASCALVLGLSARADLPAAPAAAHSDSTVTLRKENLAHITVRTEPVVRGNLPISLRAVGRLSENLNRTARVTSTLEGRLVGLHADVNDRVAAGDVVALVQTPELLGRPLELKAPIGGVITERLLTVGELIGKETPVYTISDPTSLWLLAEIKERDIAAVRAGQPVRFSVLAYPGVAFEGTVVLLGNRVESSSRTLETRIAVSNTDGRLKPGMFADVEIDTEALTGVLLVPDEALQSLDNEQVVFVATGDLTFEKRPVKTGLSHRGRLQVVSGLQEGDQVVTEGSFILKSELLKGELGEE